MSNGGENMDNHEEHNQNDENKKKINEINKNKEPEINPENASPVENLDDEMPSGSSEGPNHEGLKKRDNYVPEKLNNHVGGRQFAKTLHDKDYYKKKGDELRKREQDLREEKARDFKNAPSKNKKEENDDPEKKNDGTNNKKDNKKPEETVKPKNKIDKLKDNNALIKNKLDTLGNKKDEALSKAYQTAHPIEAGKEKLKAEIEGNLKKFLLTHPLVILGIILFFIFMMFIITLLFVVLDGDTDSFDNSYSSSTGLCASSSGGSFMDFLGRFEGNEGLCKIDGKTAYLAARTKTDGVVTVGPGVTNSLIGSSISTSLIDTKGWSKYLHYDGARYSVSAGDCVPLDVVTSLKVANVEGSYGAAVDASAKKYGVTFTQYQKDALTDLNYNLGTGYCDEFVAAYKNGGYKGFWNAIKGYVNSRHVKVPSLQKRRKAEFALFVTGDYTDQNKFYSRSLDNYDDYDSEGVMKRVQECNQQGSSGSMEESGLTQDSDGYLARLGRPLRTNKYFYDQSDNMKLAKNEYEGECAWYAFYRAQEILALSGSKKQWVESANGGGFCSVPSVSVKHIFSSSTDYKKPRKGALISWTSSNSSNPYGHVAVVEKVNSDGSIVIGEAFIGLGYYGTVQHYKSSGIRNVINKPIRTVNRKYNCEQNGSGCFRTTTLTPDKIKNKSSTLHFKCYIYLLD